MLPVEGCSGEALVLVGAAVAIQIARDYSETELLFLSAFFEVLGDNLALIATQRADATAKEVGGGGKPLCPRPPQGWASPRGEAVREAD